MCVLDFVSLATSTPGHVPTSNLTKHISNYDFVIRLCKGSRDSKVGPNQLGYPRYYVPDSSVAGGLIEVIDNGSPNYIYLEKMLKNPEKEVYVHLEDVWMTLLCPEHADIVWFVQFFVHNARSREELEEVTRRVRARRSGDPSFVEDEFTVSFNEMRGVPNRRQNLRGEAFLPSQRSRAQVLSDVDRLALWHDDPSQKSNFHMSQGHTVLEHSTDFGVIAGFEHPPESLLPLLRQFGNVGANLGNPSSSFHSKVHQQEPGGGVMQPHTVEPHVSPSNSQLRHFRGLAGDNLGRGDAISGIGISGGVEGMRTTEVGSQPTAHSLGFQQPLETGFGGGPYGIYRPEPPPPVLPLPYQQPFVSNASLTDDDGWWDDIKPIGGFSSQAGPSLNEPTAGFASTKPEATGLGPFPKVIKSQETQGPVRKAQFGPLRDTSVAGASPWAPPAGNTSGLRPVEKRTWNIETKEWRSYWVWAL